MEREAEEKIREDEADQKAQQHRSDAAGDKPDLDKKDTDFKEPPKAGDDYDGSQFNTPDFAGTDFSKSTFDDLEREMRKYEPDSQKMFVTDEEEKRKKEELLIPIGEAIAEDKVVRTTFGVLIERPYVVPGSDWGPSTLDPRQNGGFSHAHDNGSPVPFRLNGHVNLQAKPAWEQAD